MIDFFRQCDRVHVTSPHFDYSVKGGASQAAMGLLHPMSTRRSRELPVMRCEALLAVARSGNFLDTLLGS